MRKTALVLSLLALLAPLAGCGMGKAAGDTARMGDKYACLARQLKGEAQCQPDAAPQPPAADPARQPAPAQ